MSPLLVAQIFSLIYLILGISLFTSKKDWIAAIDELVNQKYGVLLFSLAALPFMIVLVLVHNIWAWTPTVLITIAGWLGLIKHVTYLWNPHLPQNFMPGLLNRMNSWIKYQAIVVTIIGLVLVYFTFFNISDIYFVDMMSDQ